MKTHFATAERARDEDLLQDIAFVNNNPVLNGLLHAASGLLAVLNRYRQILALNETLLKTLQIEDAGQALGLRPGEVISCIHAHDMPGGCGTSEFCSTCGAAIAIVTSLERYSPAEKTCAVEITNNGIREDLFLRVRALPLTLGTNRFILLFVQDISREQKLAALERAFFHDINNIVSALLGASKLLTLEQQQGNQKLARMVHRLTVRLRNEIALQKILSQKEALEPRAERHQVSLDEICTEITNLFSTHPAAQNKVLRLPDRLPSVPIKTDFSLLVRVLTNMLLNAFEAADEGEEIRLLVEQPPGLTTFAVTNRKAIPENIARRIFQRNFSTKPEIGRGLGTFSMKLFGEKYLGGNVDFTTSEQGGTIFRLSLPRSSGP